MSGPIVRKYGFPNFEKIFGERGMKHGVDEPETGPTDPEVAKKPAPDAAPSDADTPAGSSGKKG